MRVFDLLVAQNREKMAARTRKAVRARTGGQPHRQDESVRTYGAIRQNGVPLGDDRLSDVLDEAFSAERVGPNQERILPEDMTLRHGMIAESVYALDMGLEGYGQVRPDVDLTHPSIFDALIRDCPQGIEVPLEFVVSVQELEDESVSEEQYIEELVEDSVEA